MTSLSLLVCSLLLGLWIFHVTFVRPSDLDRYRKYLRKQEAASSPKTLAATAQQRRQDVRKDIWFAQEDKSRLQYRIESQSSLLSLVPVDDKLELIENLSHIKCWMQEKIFLSPQSKQLMQQMRYLQANEGTYKYMSQQFDAHAVGLSLFQLPGQVLSTTIDPRAAFLRGVAQDVSFAVSGKNPQFKAHHFKASLRQELEGP